MNNKEINIEYQFHYIGYLHYRLGEFIIQLKADGKPSYCIGAKLADEDEWKIKLNKERITCGKLASELRWILEHDFEFPHADSGWFSQQIVADFIKYLKSKKNDL